MFDFNQERQFTKASSTRIVALRQAKQSVEARQRDIYESHRHRTFALAYYMTGSEIEAEKILTGTFITAFRAAEEPEGQDVDAALVKELRQRSHLHQDAIPAATPSPDCDEAASGLGSRNIKRTDLEEAVQYLPATERLLFLLRDVEGYAPAVIAKLLDMPEQQVQRQLFSARLRLRRILAQAQGDMEKAA